MDPATQLKHIKHTSQYKASPLCLVAWICKIKVLAPCEREGDRISAVELSYQRSD